MFYELPEIRAELKPLVAYSGAFTPEEVQKVKDYIELVVFKSGGMIRGGVGDGNISTEYRDSDIFWIERSQEIDWFYDRIGHLINKVNRDFWNYKLKGFHPFQYTEYKQDGQYLWHMDSSPDTRNFNRKLSMTMMLSDPEEYDGGQFELNDEGPDKVKSTKPGKGDILFFPSHLVHRVAPITRGVRKSLVCWVIGERFV